MSIEFVEIKSLLFNRNRKNQMVARLIKKFVVISDCGLSDKTICFNYSFFYMSKGAICSLTEKCLSQEQCLQVESCVWFETTYFSFVDLGGILSSIVARTHLTETALDDRSGAGEHLVQ